MIELLRKRRSIRKFTEQFPETVKIEVLKEAVLRAPTSKNSNASQFIFVDDKSVIEKLASCKPSGASALQTATLAVVILTDESKTVAWVEDCSIAGILLQITALSLDLGSCWIQIRGREFSKERSSESFVRETLNIPEGYRVLCILAIGYPQNATPGKPYQELDFSRIHQNNYL